MLEKDEAKQSGVIENNIQDETTQNQFTQEPIEHPLTPASEVSTDFSADNLAILTASSVHNQLNILKGKSYEVMPEPEHEKTGFFKGVGLGITESGIGSLGKSITRNLIEATDSYRFPELQGQPDDWNPVTTEAMDGIPYRYMDYIYSAKSKREQELRRDWAQDDAKDAEDSSNASWAAQLTGGGLGFALDAWSVGRVTGIPLFSHQRVSANYLANIASNVGLNSVKFGTYELAKQTTKNYRDFKEVAFNTAFAALLDLPFATLHSSGLSASDVIGKARGLKGTGTLFKAVDKVSEVAGKASDAVKSSEAFKLAAEKADRLSADVELRTSPEIKAMSNSQGVFNAAMDGVNFKVEINKDGSLGKRVPESVTAMNAMARKGYQEFADNSINRGDTILNAGIMNSTLKLSPQYRGLVNPNPAINSLVNRLTPHNFITKNLEDSAQPITYVTRMDVANNRARLTKQTFKDAYKESMGALKGSTESQATKALEENIKKGQDYSVDGWNKEAFSRFSSGEQGINASMQNAMNFYGDEVMNVFNEFKQAGNSIIDYISPVTQAKYTMRHYNVIESDRVPFNEDVATAWGMQDKIINSLNAPLDSINSSIVNLENKQLENIGDPQQISDNIKALKEKRKSEQKKLDKKLRDNPEYHILLDDLTHLTSNQIKEINTIFAPHDKINEAISVNIEEIKSINSKINKQEKKIISSKDKTKRTEENKKLKKLKDDLKIIESERTKNTLEAGIELQRITSLAKDGEINPDLFWTKFDNEIIWKDRDKSPKLRKAFEDDSERLSAANDVFETISAVDFDNNSFNSSAINKFTGQDVPDPTVSRSLQIPDDVLIRGNYIHTNLSDTLNMYRTSLTKKAAIKELFPAGDFDEGFAGIEQSLEKDKQEALLNARQKFIGKEQLKEVNKISKKHRSDLAFAKEFWDAVVSPTKAGWMSQSIRNYAVGTKLGAVVFSYAPDTAGIIWQHGLGKTIQANIEVLADSIKLKELPVEEKNSMIDAAAGFRQYSTMRTNRLSDEVMGDIAPKGWRQNAADKSEKFGHSIMNLSLANAAENHIRNVGVLISQSEVIRKLNAFNKGVISDKDFLALRMIGIEPKEWAKPIMQQVKRFGSGNEKEGWGANHPEWDDINAKRVFNAGITTLDRLSVTNGLSVQAPFWMNRGSVKPFTQFMSFAFNSFYNHIVPSMQYMTQERASGLLGFLVLGSMVGPLYRMASGRPPIESASKFTKDTIAFSGLLGPFWDYMNKMDTIMQLGLLSDEKRRFRSLAGEMQGPFVGLVNDSVKSINNLARGKGTTRDGVNAAGLSGITGLWYLRWMTEQGAKALGLPEKRGRRSKASKI